MHAYGGSGIACLESMLPDPFRCSCSQHVLYVDALDVLFCQPDALYVADGFVLVACSLATDYDALFEQLWLVFPQLPPDFELAIRCDWLPFFSGHGVPVEVNVVSSVPDVFATSDPVQADWLLAGHNEYRVL